ncbi:small hydrophobic protein [Denotus virus]|nr:small hydrophobic protein [Denotus virus]
MEENLAILLFVVGFTVILWSTCSLAWLLYLTIRINTVNRDLVKKFNNLYHEVICPPADDFLNRLQLVGMPPSYGDPVVQES